MSYAKMYQPFKKAWVKALRSGKYRQGTGTLCRQVRPRVEFCCLGVACAIAELPWQFNRNGLVYFSDQIVKEGWYEDLDFPLLDANSSKVPETFARDIGLSPRAQEQLISMNDSGKSFEEIADWIDKNL